MVRQFTFFIFLVHLGSVWAGDLKRVAKKFEGGDIEKIEALIIKSLTKEPTNPGVKYFYAQLFLMDNFPRRNLDSALYYIDEALRDLSQSNSEVLDEMAKMALGKEALDSMRSVIGEEHFNRASERDELSIWEKFITNFPRARTLTEAMNARDRLIFDQVLTDPRIDNFQGFIETYPASLFRERAKLKLDSLLVLQHQNTDSEGDLEQFILENPNSEFVEDAVDHLLKLQTISGAPSDFIDFMSKYTDYAGANRALKYLFHIDKENSHRLFNSYHDLLKSSDSLINEKKRADSFYFPVFERGIKLVSVAGEVIPTKLNSLDQQIICEGLIGDIVFGSDNEGQLVKSISGHLITRQELVKDIGYGFIIVKKNGAKSLVHKSGDVIVEGIQDAEILGGQFLKIKKEKWGIRSFLGEELEGYRFDDIFIDGEFWFFERNGLLAISNPVALITSFGKGHSLEFKLEDYELIDDKTLIGFRDDRECLLKSDGSFVVPWGVQQIFPDDEYGYVKNSAGYSFFSDPNSLYVGLTTSKAFVLKVMDDSTRILSSKADGMDISFRDSVKLIGNSFAWSPKNRILIFGTGKVVDLEAGEIPQLLAGSLDHVLIESNKTSTVFGPDGNLIISGNFDKVSLLTDELFAVTFRGKTGLYDQNGDNILPMRYEHLSLQENMISMLSDQKIGGYDLIKSLKIETNYESKIEPFGSLYKTMKNGHYGLIDRNEDEVVPFEFDEIFDWTDTLVWVRKEDQFYLLNTNDLVSERTVTLLSDFPVKAENVKKFYGQNGFGLIGTESGILLQPNFSDIRLIGSETNQIVVGEQSLPQAGYRVLTYFDIKGEKIYSQAYRPDEYEKVFCDD